MGVHRSTQFCFWGVLVGVGAVTVPFMSGDLQSGGPWGVGAMAGGRLTDPGWLVSTDPVEVLAVLDGAVGREEVLSAAVYRASAHLHRDAGANVRRQLLAVDAARYGDRDLAARIAGVSLDGEPAARWRLDWATGSLTDHRFRYVLADHDLGHAARLLATSVVEGRPVAVTAGDDGTVRVWDLTSGSQIGEPIVVDHGEAWSMTSAIADARPVVMVSVDETVRAWDLTTRQPVGVSLTVPFGPLSAMATAVVDGRPVVITAQGGWEDDAARMWDLASGEPVGEPFIGINGWFPAIGIATTTVSGCPVAVMVGGDEVVRLWDLVTGAQRRVPIDGTWTAVTTAVLEGRSVAVVGDIGGTSAVVLDIETGEPVGETFAVSADGVLSMATTVVGGRPVVVVAGDSTVVRVWDLVTREQVGRPLVGHSGSVTAVATAVVEGKPVAISVCGPDDGRAEFGDEVRVWELTAGQLVGEPIVGHRSAVRAVATAVLDGQPVAVTSTGNTVRVWDAATGRQIGSPLRGFAHHLMATDMCQGHAVVVTVNEKGMFGTHDLSDSAPDGRLVGSKHGNPPFALAVTHVGDCLVAIMGRYDGMVELWNLDTGHQLGASMPGHEGWPVRAAATAAINGRQAGVTGGLDGTARI
ncbi:WD40 repeat domain-containing protein [Streptomyces sp. NPDC059153]|uniref:WD40 repeat domain-containing protein n=1 Tax=Streptomyces sp. NPDC059153 TaxID=3346743 RepID=UPI0036BE0903